MTGAEQIARFGQPISGNFPQEGIAFANFLCKDTGTDEEKEPKENRLSCLLHNLHNYINVVRSYTITSFANAVAGLQRMYPLASNETCRFRSQAALTKRNGCKSGKQGGLHFRRREVSFRPY